MSEANRKKTCGLFLKRTGLKQAALAALLALACGLAACAPGEGASSDAVSGAENSGAPLEEITVTVFKTGKADCILLELDGASVLIDTAEKGDGEEIAEELQARDISRLDLVLLTHLDKDHIGGAPDILENFEVGQLVQADYDEDSKQYTAYQEAAEAAGVTPVRLKEPLELELGGAKLTLTPGANPPYMDDNDYSILTEMAYGANRFLFAGDAEELRLSEFLASSPGTYDFLKVPHHGRYNTKTAVFLSQVQPKIAVITCSDKNPAEEETLAVLERLGTQVYLTTDGTVTLRSDGQTLSAQQ